MPFERRGEGVLLTCGLIRPMDIGRVEIAQIAVRLIRNDAVSARCMTDQARTRMYLVDSFNGRSRAHT